MKLKFTLIYCLIFISMCMIQACGSGTGASDTAGTLKITTPVATNNNDGTYKISVNTTYTPPAGKTAQGVQVKLTISDNFGNSFVQNQSLTSGSNSFDFAFLVKQTTASVLVSIVASIGDMKSSDFVVVPSLAALDVSASTADFLLTDVASSSRSIIISGGVAPYSVTSSVPADISVTNTVNSTAVITLVKTQTSATPATAIVTVTDSALATKSIIVNYFK